MIPLFRVHMNESVLEPLKNVLLSGYIGQGPKVDEFEKALVPWVGSPNCLAVNSGTSALHLAMRLAGVERGTEVITSPQTCVATNVPILERGGDIVWADIDPWTGNIDPLDVERKVTAKTRAIIAVHWGGYPCDIDELLKVARKYNLALIEDAAHAFGSTYKGRPIGSSAALVAFSFQAIKLLTIVDGGLLVCPSTESYRRGKLLRWFGIDRETPRVDMRIENDVAEYGYKFHLSDVLATIGLDQLKYTKDLLERARANAKFYDERLGNLKKIRLLRYATDRLSAYWLYTVRVNDRERFQDFMKTRDIMVSQVHMRNDVYTAFKAFRRNLPGVDEFTREQVSMPVGWWVTEQDRATIVKAVLEYEGA